VIEASVFNKCVRCGLCLPTCPTYLETLTETSGPRGRISLIKAVAEGDLDVLSPGFVHQMSECLDCRACAAVCPSGVEYGELVEAARASIARAQAPQRPWNVRLGRWFSLKLLFSNLALMRLLASVLRTVQRIKLDTLLERWGVLRALHLANAQRLAPRICERYFVPRGQRFTSTAARRTVMLHAGCIMQVAFGQVHEATVRVLQRNGCTVVVPSGQGCCGAIAQHAGETDVACKLAQRTIESFESSGAELCIINAAGCGAQLKEYALLFAGDPAWQERAAAFASRVRDVLEFLDDGSVNHHDGGLASQLGPLPVSVSYQDACHLAHAQRIVSAPRRLLRSIPQLRLLEMPESAVCCGSAGIYNLTEPEMSARLGRRNAAHAIEAGAQIVATANPGCALQMGAYLREAGSSIEVKHVVELLDDSYRAYSAAASRSRPSSAASIEG